MATKATLQVNKIFAVKTILCQYLLWDITSNHNALADQSALNFDLAPFKQITVTGKMLHSYHNTSTAIGCGVLCAEHDFCLAFYFVKSRIEMMAIDYYVYDGDKPITPEVVMIPEQGTETGGRMMERLDCLLLKSRLNSSSLTIGVGVFGTVKEILMLGNVDGGSGGDEDGEDGEDFSSGNGSGAGGVDGSGDDPPGVVVATIGSDSPPMFPYADYLYMTRTRLGPVAVYTCFSDSFSTFGWLYDMEGKNWPVVADEYRDCANYICLSNHISATIIQMQPPEGGLAVFSLYCDDDEITDGNHATCQDGYWILENSETSNSSSVSCISETCYRIAANEAAIYSGKLANSKSGLPCEFWDKQSQVHITPESVPLYDRDIAGMKNYCRDPVGFGQPFCITAPSHTQENCDVPLCEWSPHDT